MNPSPTANASSAHESKCFLTLPTFEGPLDLLLHLCQKHELDILDVPIAFVTAKYLDYLALMQHQHLDIASEYLVVAVTLAHIKSKMLVPSPSLQEQQEAQEPERDPREALILRLLEYQKYKQAALELSQFHREGDDVFFRALPPEENNRSSLPPVLASGSPFALMSALHRLFSKERIKRVHTVTVEPTTLTERIQQLTHLLLERRHFAFHELFKGIATRIERVITFLALLEMTRLHQVHLMQATPLGPLYIHEVEPKKKEKELNQENDRA
ncbi:segregation and condensation protein A [Pajaroellobacter abortibovis]|uniref:Segregation and condensation protein A n=1 Tax=Pajaroellobacter abortibovis TaxID=1882918 RepID=A0A1L6MZM6_9BACT|nr:segregation/condensation protein A [Pajaroellobacter abortibovis]APS00946.1 hypothetical protein BCY86_07080 [Pajaroellobacter abortibovis]